MHEGTVKLSQTLTNFLSILLLASMEKLSTHNMLLRSDNDAEYKVVELKLTSFEGTAGVIELGLGGLESELGATQMELGVAQLGVGVTQVALGVSQLGLGVTQSLL